MIDKDALRLFDAHGAVADVLELTSGDPDVGGIPDQGGCPPAGFDGKALEHDVVRVLDQKDRLFRIGNEDLRRVQLRALEREEADLPRFVIDRVIARLRDFFGNIEEAEPLIPVIAIGTVRREAAHEHSVRIQHVDPLPRRGPVVCPVAEHADPRAESPCLRAIVRIEESVLQAPGLGSVVDAVFREGRHGQESAAGIAGHDEGLPVDEQLGMGRRNASSEAAGQDGSRVFQRDVVLPVLPLFGLYFSATAQAASRFGLQMAAGPDSDGFRDEVQAG